MPLREILSQLAELNFGVLLDLPPTEFVALFLVPVVVIAALIAVIAALIAVLAFIVAANDAK